MSSINSNANLYTTTLSTPSEVDTSNASVSTNGSIASINQAATAGNTGGVSNAVNAQDVYGNGQAGGATARVGVFNTNPAVPATAQPTGYQANLASASNKLSAMPASSLATSDAAAMAVVQNGGTITANAATGTGATAATSSSSSGQSKADTVEKQAESLTQSAEVSHKVGCHQVHDNHKELTQKLEAVGMTHSQASRTVQLLEDGRVSDSAKSKISFELASLGVTGAGQANTAATATNASAVLSSLQNLSSKEGKKLEAVKVGTTALAMDAAVMPLAEIGVAMANKKAVGKVMQGVDSNANSLTAATFSDGSTSAATSTMTGGVTSTGANTLATQAGATTVSSDSQAVNSVYDQTLRPALAQAQQAL